MVQEKLDTQRTQTNLQFECCVCLKKCQIVGMEDDIDVISAYCNMIWLLIEVAIVGMRGMGKNFMVETLQECFHR